ncbi:MFS transporter, OFA family, oxalate/formate antiporter [Desulfonispora thiosulfatigenes DSM 11270]|uniref:MFS transporter, OFA family, oxalate/formate antiporter n=1 Tax=Desulfonispora thiosulfatigenes DSM 11270 TaxID=656914 RepID=A0A1W1V6E1_DESTI|nr:OFA family MFS transporter [Desulfonispora thiosulfatigenes]SMB88902.1 MFS transporter, OFA family, oxalate/formate antiporter [Desulfonispora thiosulfatigenes DSM 11270]
MERQVNVKSTDINVKSGHGNIKSNQILSSQVNTNRWLIVLAGLAIQLCLGVAYIWGVFQPEVVKVLDWSQKNAALSFSFLLGMLSFGSMAGGAIQEKLSPRVVVIGGGVIISLGFLLASFASPKAPWIMWLTYGILGGFGSGTVYTATIAICQKWFPDKRGLITGLIVSALGFGGLVLTPLARSLMKNVGVLETFAWLSLIFLVVTVVGGMFMKNPPEGYKPVGWTPPLNQSSKKGQDFTPGQVLRSSQFYLITFSFMLASMAGLMVIPFAKVLGLSGGLTDNVATVGVMVIAIFNSFGRLFWGYVSDKIGRENTLLILMIVAGVSILFVAAAKSYLILFLIAIVGFSYGGFLGVFPSLAADLWGTKHMGINYGLVLTGFGMGAILSSYVAGYFMDLTGKFTTPFMVAAISSLFSAAMILMLKRKVAR